MIRFGRQTKISNLSTESGVDQDVLSLEITMKNGWFGGMQKTQTLCDISYNLDDNLTTGIERFVPKEVVP